MDRHGTVNKTYAEEFASLLDAALPELGVAARQDRAALEQRRCFSFQVPCPSTVLTGPLSVMVVQNEICIEFLRARSRLTNPHEAVALIRELIAETVIVETWFGPDLSSCAFAKLSALPSHPMKMPGVTRVVRRSWRGTYDADENVA